MKSTILIVASLLVGFAGGAVFMAVPKSADREDTKDSASLLSNSPFLVSEWRAIVSGLVQDLEDNAIVLEQDGELLRVLVSPQTDIQRIVFIGKENEEAQTIAPPNEEDSMRVNSISFQDIKGGSSLEAVVTIRDDGEIEALVIHIRESN